VRDFAELRNDIYARSAHLPGIQRNARFGIGGSWRVFQQLSEKWVGQHIACQVISNPKEENRNLAKTPQMK
jgi:hypothetical protein